jgi:transcription elongation factor SPT5
VSVSVCVGGGGGIIQSALLTMRYVLLMCKQVLHVHRSNVFIYNREILENNGVFVTRARNIKVAGGGTTARPGAAPVPQSPHIHGSGDGGRGGGRGGGDGGRGGGGRGGRGRRNEMIGKTVRIIKGPLKGSMGRVKDATDTTAKIEMQARAKTVIVALNQISVTNSEASKPGCVCASAPYSRTQHCVCLV